jgi:hypothetical protein
MFPYGYSYGVYPLTAKLRKWGRAYELYWDKLKHLSSLSTLGKQSSSKSKLLLTYTTLLPLAFM